MVEPVYTTGRLLDDASCALVKMGEGAMDSSEETACSALVFIGAVDVLV